MSGWRSFCTKSSFTASRLLDQFGSLYKDAMHLMKKKRFGICFYSAESDELNFERMHLLIYQVDPEIPARYSMQSNRSLLDSATSDPSKPTIALSPPPEASRAMLGSSSCKECSKYHIFVATIYKSACSSVRNSVMWEVRRNCEVTSEKELAFIRWPAQTFPCKTVLRICNCVLCNSFRFI